jgi:hypothetical protein
MSKHPNIHPVTPGMTAEAATCGRMQPATADTTGTVAATTPRADATNNDYDDLGISMDDLPDPTAFGNQTTTRPAIRWERAVLTSASSPRASRAAPWRARKKEQPEPEPRQTNLLSDVGSIAFCRTECTCGWCSKRRRLTRWLRGGAR